jgi:hypothetical protein
MNDQADRKLPVTTPKPRMAQGGSPFANSNKVFAIMVLLLSPQAIFVFENKGKFGCVMAMVRAPESIRASFVVSVRCQCNGREVPVLVVDIDLAGSEFLIGYGYGNRNGHHMANTAETKVFLIVTQNGSFGETQRWCRKWFR